MTQWKNIKCKVKSRESEYRRALSMTGGGPPPPSPSAEDLAIIEALPNEFSVKTFPFDNDSLYSKAIKQLETENQIVVNKPKMPNSTDQIDESQEVIKITDNTQNSEAEPQPGTNTSTPLSTPKKPFSRKRRHVNIPKIKRVDNGDCHNYEHQLFQLAKKSKEKENERAEELHQRRLKILELEEEYWKKKINKE